MNEQRSQKIFFFRYGEEAPFAIDTEAHAWDLYAHQSSWTKRGLKYVGQSNGDIYYEMIKEIAIQGKELQGKIDKVKKDLARYDDTFKQFKFKDLMGDKDPQMIKLNSLTETLEKELEDLTDKQSKIKKEITNKATEAEITEARKNITPPTNTDFNVSQMSDKKIPLEAFNQFKK